MGVYRISRNTEASIVDFLKTSFQADWGSNNVEKSFAQIYEIDLPSICVRAGVSTHTPVEVGSNSTWRTVLVSIDIFATSDGQRLDIKDWLISKVKNGINYYNYTISNGVVQSKTLAGRINIRKIEDEPLNFDTEKDELDTHDKYRHLITLTISLGKTEV